MLLNFISGILISVLHFISISNIKQCKDCWGFFALCLVFICCIFNFSISSIPCVLLSMQLGRIDLDKVAEAFCAKGSTKVLGNLCPKGTVRGDLCLPNLLLKLCQPSHWPLAVCVRSCLDTNMVMDFKSTIPETVAHLYPSGDSSVLNIAKITIMKII